MNDKCKNCGGDAGIHHYETNRCPVGGREAPIGRSQEYMTTTFQKDDSDELEELRSSVKQVLTIVQELNTSFKRIVEALEAANAISESDSNTDFMVKLYKVE